MALLINDVLIGEETTASRGHYAWLYVAFVCLIHDERHELPLRVSHVFYRL